MDLADLEDIKYPIEVSGIKVKPLYRNRNKPFVVCVKIMMFQLYIFLHLLLG